MEHRIKLDELFYLLYFGVMLGAKAVGLYEGQFAYNVCLVIGACLWGIKIIITKHSFLEYLILCAFMALGLLTYRSSGEKSLLIFLTMMLGMKCVSVDRVFKTGAIIWVGAFVGMYVLSVIGIIPEVAFTIDRASWPPILRHSLGYPHPNTLHITYFILCIFVIYVCKNLPKKAITAIAVILMIGNCYVFIYSLSRNGFLITSIFVVILLYFLHRTGRSKLENILIEMIFPICALSMVVLPLVLKGEALEKINTLFAGRIKYSLYYLTYEPLKLFGIREIPVPYDSFVIDSSYVYILFRLGIIAYVLYFVAMLFLVHDLLRKNRIFDLSVVLALTIGGINETYLANQSYKNLIMIFMGSLFYFSMAQLIEKKQGFATRETIGFSVGGKELAYSVPQRFRHRRIPTNILAFTAFLFIVVGLLTSIVYVVAVPIPNNIYIPQQEYTKGEYDIVYLSKVEVKEIKKQGDIIRGYVDESTPLYRMYRKGVAQAEYIRYIFSYGLWAGSLVSIVFLLIWTTKYNIRYLMRNKRIGDDYKENVLIVHNYYRIPGGEDIVVANEKALLEQKGHKVILYSRNNADAGDRGFWQKVGLAFVSLFNIRTYRDICRLIEKEKIDVIQVHNTVALVSPSVYLAGINRGVPVVQTIHNFRLICPNGVCYIHDHICERCIEHGLKASLLYNCYRDSKLQTFVSVLSMRIQRFIRTYRAINYICLTEFNKEKLLSLKQIKEENIYIKPNFTTLESTLVPYSDRKRQIVYAGRIEKIKGVDLLLQAWMKLGENAPKLIVCGSGELESWCHEYIDNNEIKNVEFLGQVSNAEAKKLVGESLAIIYPTQWYEGFPMAVAEAYTVGTPIIAADIGNVGNLVVEGVTGIKFKHNSVVALANAVEKFMSKPIELPEEYMKKYTAENNYAILKSIFESIRKKGNM